MALQIGERVGDYEVLALLGAGGMGQVYKVRNIISNREEAMKVLLPDLTSERELAVRFMMEIRTLAGLEHPNIAQLRTAFQFQNQLIMIMEYVEGVTLEKLATQQAIPVERVLDYATQVLSALSFAHTHGVIHRDIKPANIMITTHGMVKLMDFGIAKNAEEMHLTRPGMTIGSVYYISPEQIRDGTVDARSDLYSFGITLYELLTRRKPFQADTSYTVLHAQCNEPPVPPIEVNPALSPALNAIVLRALEKDPANRFQSAQEFHDALKTLVEQGRPSAAAVAVPFTPTLADELSATLAGYKPVPGTASATSAGIPAQQTASQAVPPPAPPPPAQSPAAPPAFAPVAVMPTPQPAKSHRGLWIGLGALAAVLALVAVAVVLPRLYAIYAKQKAAVTSVADTSRIATALPSSPTPDAAASPAPANPADASAGAPPAPTPAPPIPAGTGPAAAAMTPMPAPAPAGKSAGHGQANGQPRPVYSGGGAVAAPAAPSPSAAVATAAPSVAGPSPQQVREAKDKLMNIEARADAARSGVQSLRTQQQAQGLDLRGDIVAALSRLNNDLREAHTALSQNDLESAEQYMARADKETATLEAFLGR